MSLIVHQWFCSYLTGIKHYAKYKGKCLNMHEVIIGVPEGSVLGPLLFLLYTRGLLFADDTTIYYSHHLLEKLFEEVNNDLALLSDWFKANKLLLYVSKTNYVLFHATNMPIKGAEHTKTWVRNNN